MGTAEGALPYFERVLTLSPNHPAAQHYLTHAYENTGRIAEALEHGAAYARLAPKIPHARHMYGHNLRRAGRIDEAIVEFRAAYDLETDPARVRDVPVEYDWHHPHNLDLLASSYQYIGQMRAAEPLLRRSFELPTPFVVQAFNKHEWPVFLLARGRTADALTAARTLVSKPAPLVQAIGHVMEGRALLATRQYGQAAEASNTAMKDLDRAGPEAALAAADLKALQAEFFLRTGQRTQARPLFEDAVRRLRARAGPDGWSQALFRLEAMTRIACTEGDWALAAYLADQMRAHDPAYGGTHFALALVARHEQDRDAERRELEAAKTAWSKADGDLPELHEITSRLLALSQELGVR
jgi:tetratricopeptide (TPR) repeat protein